ncbi:MAG: hypothetical protein A2157_18000 [Deltaproteobacteria bacterium RBG_16_47_11]|nr:MAG: hypothetical protein A2157_18000 [Deltaproteobacteria bacterium RBG_16_47_11]
MLKQLTVVVLGIITIGLAGCNIKTPEIHGVVLDSETKQPVEGAWVRATLEIKSKTVQGDVTSYLSVDSPHTRTDKHGKFLIPSRTFKKPPFPVGFGTEAINFGIGAATVDDRGGRINLKGEKLEEFLGKKKLELTIYSGPVERTEAEYSSHLQSLYKYCLTGRSSVEVPSVEGGCDEWELAYAIAKHEGFLKRLEEPKTMDQRIHYAGTMKQLAYLYKIKGDFKKALETFNKVKSFEEKRGVDLWLREFEHEINDLQQKIREN